MDSPNDGELQIDNQDELDALFEDDDENNEQENSVDENINNNNNNSKKKNKAEDLFGSDDEEEGGDVDLNLSLERGNYSDTHTEQYREPKRRTTSQSADIQDFYDNKYPPKDSALIRVKLPNILTVQPKPYDPITFQEDEFFEDRSGVVGVENVIRWRWVKNKSGALVPDSNAKITKWSDGSMFLHLGTEILQVTEHDLGGEHSYIFSRNQPSILSCHGRIEKRIMLRPQDERSKFHNRLTKTMAEVSKKVTRVRLVSTTADPEKEKERLEAQEEERIKSIQKLDAARQTTMNKYRVSNSYLENPEEEYQEDEEPQYRNDETVEEEEEDLDILFDNRHSRASAPKKRQYRDEEEEAQRLLKAKSSTTAGSSSSSRKSAVFEEEGSLFDEDVVIPTELEDEETAVVKKTKRGRAIIDDDE
eukprot:TRINITY_DN3069_c0_g6_i1.p1 TRINITY_DN3069_c0_g6~~TRINITY_DN3069_c0_g6_i1.p1  ORF type:complete len:419 (+),score=106.89 TRINITY_DN3069_c0_g6_i1:231-1487(+)